MSIVPFAGSAGMTGLAAAALLATLLTTLLGLLLVPSLLPMGARPEGAARALFNYLMQTIGIVLMTASGFPALSSVFTGSSLAPQGYLFLLIVFAAGGLTFLWYERHVAAIDPVSRAVPALLFKHLFKLLGYLLTLGSALSILLTILFAPLAAVTLRWWVHPLLLLAYGLFLLWSTGSPAAPRPFRSEAMNGAQRPAPKAPAKKKK